MATHILDNGLIRAEILTDWGYNRSRYDWGGTVAQVKKDGHTFISRELTPNGGTGLGGIGLTNVFEWKDTLLYEKASIADNFPLLGVGLLKKGDTQPFLFTKDYAVTPFQRIVDADESQVKVRTLPHMCFDTAVDMTKTYYLDRDSLTVSFYIRNTGKADVHATEYCHNFIKFDDKDIDSSYRVSFPYSICPKLRRGEIIMERDAYRLGAFDEPTQSSAFWVSGWEGMKSHWMRIANEKLGMSVLIEDDFPICGFYSWNNVNACCPEVFAPIDILPGERVSYTRKYTFSVDG